MGFIAARRAENSAESEFDAFEVVAAQVVDVIATAGVVLDQNNNVVRASPGAISQSVGISPASSWAVVEPRDWTQAVAKMMTPPTRRRRTHTGKTQSGREKASARISATCKTTQAPTR